MKAIGDILKNYQSGTHTLSLPPTPNLMPLLKLKNIQDMAKSLNVNLEHTFANFKKVTGGESLVTSFRAVITGPRFFLLIYGGVGNGKTHLLEAAAITLYQQGLFTRVMNYSRMLNTLKSAINNPNLDYQEILDNYCYSDRLIIDDIGAGGSDTEFSDRILETIVCARYGHQLLTIMSMNRDIAALPERVLSRLRDRSVSFLILNKAEDFRLRKETVRDNSRRAKS